MPAAAAAVVTATFAEFLLGWKTAKLKRLVDVFLDGFPHLVKLLLGVNEAARHGIVEQRIPLLLEV